MNGFDVACLIAAAVAALAGWRQGILVRLITAAGALGGLLVAAANVDAIARRLPRAESTPRVLGVLAALACGWLVGRVAGGLVGRAVRRRLPEVLVASDRLIGCGAGILGVVVTIWLAVPVMSLLPGWPSTAVRGSTIARTMEATVGVAPLPIDQELWPKSGSVAGLVPGLNATDGGPFGPPSVNQQ